MDREEFLGAGGPGVVDDSDGAVAEGGNGGETVAGAGDESVEAAETVKDDTDARLQGGDFHGYLVWSARTAAG